MDESTSQSTSRSYCSDLSIAAGEQLFGTAPRTELWLMLEYPYPWGRKALEESTLPEKVVDALKEIAEKYPHTRIELIKQTSAPRSAGIHFFIAHTCDQEPVVHQFILSDYSDLLQINVAAIIHQPATVMASTHQSPLFLICTNGRRDACCARLGVPVYNSIAQEFPLQTWQATHVGGHRFAANLAVLPHGLLYGRVNPSAAYEILQSHAAGEIQLEYLRGRACFSPASQAAEYYLRRETAQKGLNAFRWQNEHAGEADRVDVKFLSTTSGKSYTVKLDGSLSIEGYQSCGETKLSKSPQFELLAIQEV